MKETTRLEKEEREEQWERKQKQYEFEINQLEERAKLKSIEIEKLRKENEQLKKLREKERLKGSQEVEQRNKVGRVISPQGTLVVRDLIDLTRRMKQRLGQTLIRETQIKMETRDFKLLGVTICHDLSWESNISKLVSKANRRLGILRHAKSFFDTPELLTTNKAFIRSLMEYCSPLWDGANASHCQGNRSILVMMDYFTKWPEAFALPNQEAGVVAKAFAFKT